MPNPRVPLVRFRPRLAALLFIISLSVVGCGGESDTGAQQLTNPSAVVQTRANQGLSEVSTGALWLESGTAAIENSVIVEPTYHLAPVFPPEPSFADPSSSPESGSLVPQTSLIPDALAQESTVRLRVDQVTPAARDVPKGVTPMAAVTYSPAQIRAAYSLPPIPSSWTGLSAAQAAQFGAGQTIYVVDAYHDLYAESELAAFSQRFGLPECIKGTLPSSAALPLGAPPSRENFFQVFATSSGGMTDTAPAYDANWAVEIALDVQWARAIAPLARIVLIEAPDSSMAGMTGAIQLANRMGPGVVSMSFGATEASYVTSLDSYFKTPGMSYFAATGDNGAGLSWPAVAPTVVAVGGTSLSFNGTSARTETVWTGTGGGVSAYEPLPSYQTNSVPGLGRPARRSVADVAFNANPSTGQYVAVISNQTSSSTFLPVGWITAGGTSLATPQWAALTAVANAMRAQSGKPVLDSPQNALYGEVATVAADYSACFLDVTTGNNGAGAANSAKVGYDTPTGLGTPRGLSLLTRLSGASTPAVPPSVTSSSVSGLAGSPLTFTPLISCQNAYTPSLSNAPTGMTINTTTSVVSWPSPLTGNYSVKVVVKDKKTGLSGEGTYQIKIETPPAPRVSDGVATGTAGKALSFKVAVAASNTFTVTQSGSPSGMSVDSKGNVTWSKPTAGSYSVKFSAKDTKTNLVGQGTYLVAVSSTTAAPPTVSSGSIVAGAGAPLKLPIACNALNSCTYSISGGPSGMTIDSSGVVNWASAVAGTHNVSVTVKDSKTALSGKGSYQISVGAVAGPTIAASSMLGAAGKPLSATITVTNGAAGLSGLGIEGAPLGMTFVQQSGGLNSTTASWPSPKIGTYLLKVTASDSGGNRGVALLPLVITAK